MKKIELTAAILNNQHIFYDRGWVDRVNMVHKNIKNVNDGISKGDYRRGLRNLPDFTKEELKFFKIQYRKGWFAASKNFLS